MEEYAEMGIVAKKQRNSSIELLKILAMAMIALGHARPVGTEVIPSADYIIQIVSTNDPQMFIIDLFALGGIGNAIFVICSVWFLVDDNRVTLKKLSGIYGDTFVISILILSAFLAADVNIPIRIIIKQIFPVLYANNWFITAYILLYLIHPGLNLVINNINRKVYFYILSFMFLIYSIVNAFAGGTYFSTAFVGFCFLYLLIGYYKRYLATNSYFNSVKNSRLVLGLGIGLYIAYDLLINFLGLRYPAFSDKMNVFSGNIGPITLLIVFPLFNLARQKCYYNKRINAIASTSMLFYIIHENFLVRSYLKLGVYYQNIYAKFGYDRLILWILLYWCLLIVCGGGISILYQRTLQKPVHVLSVKIFRGLLGLLNKVYVLLGRHEG